MADQEQFPRFLAQCPRERAVPQAAESRLARRGAFEAEDLVINAEPIAETADRFSLFTRFRAQAVIDGEGNQCTPQPRCPVMGKDQQRQRVASAGDGNPDGIIKQAGRQRRERRPKGRLRS